MALAFRRFKMRGIRRLLRDGPLLVSRSTGRAVNDAASHALRSSAFVRSSIRTLGLIGAVAVTMAQTIEYKRSSNTVYDAARLASSGDFATSQLLEDFKHFAATECRQRQLARLTVATSESDLMKVLNVELPPISRIRIPDLLRTEPALLGANLGQLTAAEVLCFGDNVTAFVRRGTTVSRHQLSGNVDARDLNLRGYRLALVGFRFDKELSDVARQDPNLLPDQVRIYATAGVLPSIDVAEELRMHIEKQIGTQTYLFLRTAPFFFDYRGPRLDMFAATPATISADEFLVRPYIVCRPDGTKGTCRLMKSPTETVTEQRPR